MTKTLPYKEWVIGQHLRRFSLRSFKRWGDVNQLPNSISYANYFGGTYDIDTQAEDITEAEGIIIEPEDIVQYVYTHLRNPFCRNIKPQIDYGEPTDL